MTEHEDLMGSERVPLCFDTCAMWGFGSRNDKDLPTLVRGRFPERTLLVPAYVVAELARQVSIGEHGKRTLVILKGYLTRPELKLRIIGLGSNGSGMQWMNSWIDVVGRFDAGTWKSKEKARFADHLVHAMARWHGPAVLVTDDGKLREQVEALGGTVVRQEELRSACA